MARPGMVVVWSGERPRHDAISIVDSLILGRDLLDPEDIEISRKHTEIRTRGHHLEIIDLGGRNGTLVNGELLRRGVAVVAPPAVVRIGRTVAIAVDDIAMYQAPLARCHGAVIGGALAEARRRIDAVALAEEHLTVLGSLAVGRALAGGYADRIGGDRLEVELDPMTTLPLDRAIDRARSPRTMILTLDRPLTDPDRPELEQWLETDVRLVTVARCTASFTYMPKELRARLMPHVVELPARRYDELPATVADLFARRAPGMRIHASLIEVVLLLLEETEERLFRSLGYALDGWIERDQALVRGSDFEDYRARDAAMRNCMH